MKVNVKDLLRDTGNQQRLVYEQSLEPLDLGGESFDFLEPVHVETELTYTGEEVWTQVEAKTSGEMQCTRCLDPVKQPIHIEYHIAYKLEKDMNTDEHEDPDVHPYDGRIINLKPSLRAQLRLAIPLQHLCQPDCKGLCPQCGQNLNEADCGCERDQVDPRLAVLAELDFEDQDGEERA